MEETGIKQVATDPILKNARTYILAMYDQYQETRLVFHHYDLAYQTALLAERIAIAHQTDPKTKEVAVLGAWFLNCGLLVDYENPIPQSIKELRKFFSQYPYPEPLRSRVVQCMQTVSHGRTAVSDEEKVLADAWNIAAYLGDFHQQLPLLRLEWELMEARLIPEVQWLPLQRELLMGLKLYTHTGKTEYEPLRGEYLLQLRSDIHKKEKKAEKIQEPGRFEGLEKSTPVRAVQTFFRTNYRNHINLSSIADNKANIMISVNSIMISILITFLSYRNITQTNPMILLPVVLFLVTGLSSLIFAVLSARPKITSLNQNEMSKEEIRKNIVFFGNFASLDLETYEEVMDEVFHSDELLYGNMVRDLYFLGKVLEKKYNYLSVSYNIFMLGLTVTVGSFLIVLFG